MEGGITFHISLELSIKNTFNNAHGTRKHYYTLGHPLQNMHNAYAYQSHNLSFNEYYSNIETYQLSFRNMHTFWLYCSLLAL